MKAVIQCAGDKQGAAGCAQLRDGRRVLFRSHPSLAPPREGHVFAHPDEPSDDGRTWRERLLAYNARPVDNPWHLLPAGHLYKNRAYQELIDAVDDTLILSAGWGLIPSTFLTPDYDITFRTKDAAKKRRSRDRFEDFRMIDAESRDPLVFFGGTAYFSLFCRLTGDYKGRRIAVYCSGATPNARGVDVVRYPAEPFTNWHYVAVADFVAGRFDPLQ